MSLNNKIIFTTAGGETYEIHRNAERGFSVWWLKDEATTERVSGECRTVRELADTLMTVALFSGDEELQLAELAVAVREVENSIAQWINANSEIGA